MSAANKMLPARRIKREHAVRRFLDAMVAEGTLVQDEGWAIYYLNSRLSHGAGMTIR
jgi:hypothetical protein